MSGLRLRALVALVLMGAAFAGAYAWKPTELLVNSRPKVELEQMFPRTVGEWAVDDRLPVQLVSPDQQALINKIYNQTLSRTYVNRTGQRVMLSVAYGGDQSDATRAHRPEVCYPAQGFQVLSSEDSSVQTTEHSLRVRKLVAQAGGRVEPISYWIIVGNRVTLSGTEQKFAQLSYSVRGVVPDGMLVRVSTVDSNVSNGFEVQQRFIQQMSQAVPVQYREQVFGSRGD